MLVSLPAKPVAAAEDIYFSAETDITTKLVAAINAEPVTGRIDMSIWHLTEGAITNALITRFNAGVPIRLIGDRAELFELNAVSKGEFYRLANAGVPIRVRVNPTWYPEINHWKMTHFKSQKLVAFGSANYTPFELAPASPTNYKDETVLFSDDAEIVNAIKTKFDQIWNDTMVEPESMIPGPPYLLDWWEACETDHTNSCDDFHTQYPNAPHVVTNTARLEPDIPILPPDLIWGQGPSFNNRLIQEINNETSLVQFVIFRLTVGSIADALLNKFNSGVPVQLLVEPQEYENRNWPEFWLTHAYLDKLWAAGVPIKKRAHQGLTHMKTLVTSNYASNASSNYAAAWQRDINYFIPRAGKPVIYQKIKDQVTAMWNNPAAFEPFVPLPPDTPALSTPLPNATAVPTPTSLVWNRTVFATSYDVWMGPSSSNLTLVGNVPAQFVNDPPETYSFTPTGLQGGTTYFWQVVARTFATPVDGSLVGPSSIRSFTTAGTMPPPAAPANPTPASAAVNVSTLPTLTWSAGVSGTTFNVAFGPTSTPPQVATGLASPSFSPGGLTTSTTYFWRVTAVSPSGSTPGPLWSFTTSSSGTPAPGNVVIYANDVTTLAGTWSKTNDATAAGGVKLTSTDNGVAALSAPVANPANYFETTFDATGGTRYRVWFRIHAIGNQKLNDSFFVQFSDSLTSTGTPAYRIGTTGGYIVNLWTCADCQSVGWGWQRNAYWLADTGDIWFQNSGPHTIRVQNREDGVEIDQIVLSPVTYGTNAPGPVSNDNTIVPKPTPPTAPGAPGSPSPSSGATNISTSAVLTWTSAGATTYDVKFGTANPPPQVVTGSSTASYTPTLAAATTYFWQIVAGNAQGTTTGPIWSFTTSSAPALPSPPTTPSPVNGATGVSTTPVLTWSATGATNYDVRFGTANPPPAVSLAQAGASYTPPALANGSTYFWQIVARNAQGTTTGAIWSFTTSSAPPPPPGTPASPSPANSATGVATSAVLTWTSTGATTYDVKFGTANPLPQVVTGSSTASYTPTLAAGTTYLWQIVAHNAQGTTTGPTWSFTTAAAPPPPGTPASPSPANSATGVATSAVLTWTSTGATTYDVKFGTANPLPQVVTGSSTASYTPTLAAGTTYLWQIVAHNAQGTTTGPTWSFTTAAAPPPPGTPASPSPASGATGVSTTPVLTWSAAGATNYDVRFGTANPPPAVSLAQAAASYTPSALTNGSTYFWQIVARNGAGETTGPIWSFTVQAAPPANIVIYASDVVPAALHGSWTSASDATSPNGIKLVTTDTGAANLNNPVASPTDYFEVPFTPAAGVPYTIWLRLRALNNNKFNDAVWVQFSNASAGGAQVYPIGSTSGLLVNLATDSNATSLNAWGWQNGAYWIGQSTTLTFPAGSQTVRIQIREDGVQLDQIVLSPSTYLNTPPGPVGNDNTIVAKPTPPGPPAAPASPTPASGATNVGITPALTWSAAGATAYDVRFGTANPPPQVVTGQAASSYAPAALQYSTLYFWQIVARNGAGSVSGPIWSFTTAAAPPPPSAPASPAPANLATSVPTTATLSWTATNASSFDVKFGTANPPTTVVSAGQAGTTYAPALVAGTTYFWQVIATNASGSTTGPVWSFTTAATPPATPGTPSPASGAVGVNPTPTLSWSASGASNYDVRFGIANPPPTVSTAQPGSTYTPGTLSSGITYFWQIVAHNSQGTATGPIWSFTTAVPPPGNIVIYADDIQAASLHGSWTKSADATSPVGVKLVTTDVGATNLNNPVAAPVDYVDINFTAAAGTPYTVWLRLKALGNSKFNDAVWVQFSGASVNGAPAYQINSTAGLMVNLATDATATSLNNWGWQNTAYWLSQATRVTFPAGGPQTLRIQIREDGVQLDQIVLSPSTYLNAAPGPVTNDATIVPKP